MTVLAQDLRTLITGTTTISSLISTRCHYNHLPQQSAYPHVWFRVTGDPEDLTMDGVGGLHGPATVDLECASTSPTVANNLADAVKTKLHGFKGTMGNATAAAVFVDDKDDDYIPFSNESDEGVTVISYGLRIWYST